MTLPNSSSVLPTVASDALEAAREDDTERLQVDVRCARMDRKRHFPQFTL